MRNDPGRMIAAGGLILMGAAFLLAQVFDLSVWAEFWPMLILLPGLAFLGLAFSRNPQHSGFIFPGLLITGTAAILFLQNLTGHWESWAYAWTAYPVLVGGALLYHGQRHNGIDQIKVGRAMLILGTLGFIGFAILFEMFIFNGIGTGLVQFIVPVMLIAAGAWLLLGNVGGNRKRKISV